MSGGIKHDQAKAEIALVSPSWLLGVADVLTFGARKYAAHNWRKGLAVSRLLSAAMRHILAFLGGENLDPESGLHHLLHASCCLMFAHETVTMRPENDDRWKAEDEDEKLSRLSTQEIERRISVLTADYKKATRKP